MCSFPLFSFAAPSTTFPGSLRAPTWYQTQTFLSSSHPVNLNPWQFCLLSISWVFLFLSYPVYHCFRLLHLSEMVLLARVMLPFHQWICPNYCRVLCLKIVSPCNYAESSLMLLGLILWLNFNLAFIYKIFKRKECVCYYLYSQNLSQER